MKVANRVLAVATALAVTVAGLLLAAEIALARIAGTSWVLAYDDWYDAARRNSWESSGPRWMFIGLTAAGLGLFFMQMAKRSPRSLPLGDGRSRAGVARRSLEQTLARAAGSLDGVSGAKAHVDGRRARVVVSTGRRAVDLRPRVEEVAGARLRSLGLADPPKVVVDVNRRGEK